jgi:nitrogen regulatory protein PII
VTIVKKGKAEKVIRAAMDQGAEGATVIFAQGTDEKRRGLFSLDFDLDKEIVLILVLDELADNVIDEIVSRLQMNKPNQGILFSLDAAACIGVVHMEDKGGVPVVDQSGTHEVIFTIVNRGYSDKVVNATKDAGARGGTIVCGRGTGIHEKAKLLGIPIEPEKEIILTLIEKEKTGDVLDAITKAAELNTPGKGIAFVINVSRVEGISHSIKLP